MYNQLNETCNASDNKGNFKTSVPWIISDTKISCGFIKLDRQKFQFKLRLNGVVFRNTNTVKLFECICNENKLHKSATSS